MNKILFIIACLLVAFGVQAQDIIVRNDGSTILAKVQKVTKNEVEYKKHSNPDGPTYTIAISEITAINYENGEKDTFTITSTRPSYATTFQTNQSDQAYKTNETASQFSNDKQLLSMYNREMAIKYRKKAKTWKLTGLIGGGILLVGGIVAWCEVKGDSEYSWIGLTASGVGVAGGLTCFLIGNHYSKLANNASSG